LESRHPLEDKAPRFVGHCGALYPGLTTPLGRRFAIEDDGSNDLVIVLDGIDKLQPNLLKVLLSGHEIAPFRVSTATIVLL
jgi:hypothetical protein